MILVLIGMIGLAVDGGRAYVDRREIQDAVDAGALAAGDNFLNTGNQLLAQSAASREFAANMRITGAESDSNWGSDNSSATWTDYPGSFSIAVSHNAFNGTNFTLQATHRLTLAFMQALGIPPLITTAAVPVTGPAVIASLPPGHAGRAPRHRARPRSPLRAGLVGNGRCLRAARVWEHSRSIRRFPQGARSCGQSARPRFNDG